MAILHRSGGSKLFINDRGLAMEAIALSASGAAERLPTFGVDDEVDSRLEAIQPIIEAQVKAPSTARPSDLVSSNLVAARNVATHNFKLDKPFAQHSYSELKSAQRRRPRGGLEQHITSCSSTESFEDGQALDAHDRNSVETMRSTSLAGMGNKQDISLQLDQIAKGIGQLLKGVGNPVEENTGPLPGPPSVSKSTVGVCTENVVVFSDFSDEDSIHNEPGELAASRLFGSWGHSKVDQGI